MTIDDYATRRGMRVGSRSNAADWGMTIVLRMIGQVESDLSWRWHGFVVELDYLGTVPRTPLRWGRLLCSVSRTSRGITQPIVEQRS